MDGMSYEFCWGMEIEMTVGKKISGFGEHIGIVVERAEAGESRLVLAIQPHHLNFFGIVHGGVILTLLDQTCGLAQRSASPGGLTQSSVTIDLQTVFVAAAKGDRLIASGTCLRRGRSVAHCTARVEDAEGTLVATANGTFKILR